MRKPHQQLRVLVEGVLALNQLIRLMAFRLLVPTQPRNRRGPCGMNSRCHRPRSRVPTIAAVALCLWAMALAGCKVESDLGQRCFLTKRAAADGGATSAVSILESEIVANSGRDYVSLGSVDCEEVVCIRDAQFVPSAGRLEAEGYCSKPCQPQLAAPCGENTQSAVGALECRAALLDDQTLARICKDDPTICKDTFRGFRSPYYCLRRASTADAGGQVGDAP